MALGLAGCGGGGGGGSAPPSTGSSAPSALDGSGGIWTGAITSGHFNNYVMFGIAAKGGPTKFWVYPAGDESSGMELAPGTLTASSTSFDGPYLGLANNVSLANSTLAENGTISGAVDTSNGQISGSYASSDKGSKQDTGNFSLLYDMSDYKAGSNADTLLQNGGAFHFNVHIGSNAVAGTLQFVSGSTSNTDNVSGIDDQLCNYAGSATTPDASYNAYLFAMTRSCEGSPEVHLTGVGAFFASSSTLRVIVDNGTDTGMEIVGTQGS